MAVTLEIKASTKDWVALSGALATDFATRAAEHDANDSFVAENYQALREAKLFSAPVPAELGGGGSTALSYSMHSHLLQALIWRWRHNATPPAEPLLRRIAAEELILVSTGGSDWLEGSGTLTKKNGDYLFNARKIFGSGSPSGDLLLTTGIYDDPGTGPTVLHFGVNMRGPGVKVLDNWRTMGMRGTGSNDIVIENVAVADAAVSVRRPKGKWHRFFDVVSPIIWPLVGAAYLGVAESAREIAVAQVQKKRDDPIVQQLVGEMDTELANARMAWEQLVAGGAAAPAARPANPGQVYQRRKDLVPWSRVPGFPAAEGPGGGLFLPLLRLALP